MALVMIIAGAVWFGFAALFVLSLMCAARRGVPTEEQLELKAPAANMAQSPLREPLPAIMEEPATLAADCGEPVTSPSGMALAMQSPLSVSD